MLLERLQRPVRGVRIVRTQPTPVDPGEIAAQIIPYRRLDDDEVRRVMRQLRNVEGTVVTSALAITEQAAFRHAGFTDREPLHLLRHPLDDIPASSNNPADMRAGRRSDTPAVLDIDSRSFDSFWALDREALSAARKATPVHRYRVAAINKKVVGYAITGRSGRASFLQRLGVDTNVRNQGIGTELVVDALRWAANEGAHSMLVNTQVINIAALALYESLGFKLSNDQLMVLQWSP